MTPDGSWNPTATEEIRLTCSLDVLAGVHDLPMFCCAAAWAVLNKGHTREAPCTVLAPLSIATIAWVVEDGGSCHVVPDKGTDVPTGARAMIPLPSAPNDPVHVQPTVGPMSINAPVSSL